MKTQGDDMAADEDTMRSEYDFSQGKRGVTARRYAQGANVVVITGNEPHILRPTSKIHEEASTMPDDLKKRRPHDGKRINLNQPHEVNSWCVKFDCTEDELGKAVSRVGNDADAVAAEIERIKVERQVPPPSRSRDSGLDL